MLKKIVALCLSICLVFTTGVMALAQESIPKISTLNKEYVYLTEESSFNELESLDIKHFKISKSRLDDSILVADFFELRENDDILAAVKEALKNGKYIYIRAPKYTANQSILCQLFGAKDNGTLMEADDEYFKLRENTLGYLSFLDSMGNFQCSRLMVDTRAPEAGTTDSQGNTVTEGSANKDIQIISTPTLEKEMEYVDDAFAYVGANMEFQAADSSDNTVKPQAFNYGKEHYYRVYDTIAYNYQGIYYGSATRKISAYRISPEATNNTGAPSPAASSSTETRWAWMITITMSPNYHSDDEVRNYDCTMEVLTFPKGTGNATYRQILWDYTPKTSLEGKTDVTCQLNGALSENPSLGASVGFTATFKDIGINLLSFSTGFGLDYNVFGMRYDVNNFNVYMPSEPAKNVTDFPIGVVTINSGDKRACIQLNSKVAWNTVNIWGTESWARWDQDAVVWALPVR